MRLPILAAASLVVLVSGCSTLQQLSTTNVPVKSIVVAINAVDAAETAATSYVAYCTPKPQPAGCSDAFIRNSLKPAVTDARSARDAAEQFIVANPDAKLGPATLVSALTTATSTLQSILAAHATK